MFVQLMFHGHPKSFKPFWSSFQFIMMVFRDLNDPKVRVQGLLTLFMAFKSYCSSLVFVHILFMDVQGRSTYFRRRSSSFRPCSRSKTMCSWTYKNCSWPFKQHWTSFSFVHIMYMTVQGRSNFLGRRSSLFRQQSRSETRCSWAITLFISVQVVSFIVSDRSRYVQWPFKVVPPTLDAVPVRSDGVACLKPGVQGLKMFVHGYSCRTGHRSCSFMLCS